MKHLVALMLLAALAGCGADKTAFSRSGILNDGSILVANVKGKIEAYPPVAGAPKNGYTVTATTNAQRPGTAFAFDQTGKKLLFSEDAGQPLSSAASVDYLVRVPQGVRAQFQIRQGDIDVFDVNAPVVAFDETGNIKIQIPSYVLEARTGTGNVSVTFGDLNWPGALNFSSDNGDVEVYVPALANARVDLHTDHGTIFTDFDLRGSAKGNAETILGSIGSGGAHSVVVRVKNGNVRLLKLTPQM